jgi:2-polyprenyl-6-methoxyphenol hydroxylase-like FAD-dependent oxidoreductase
MGKRALVIGGGIGGLAAAAGLVRGGWEVRVCERAPEPSRAGTGLGIWPQAVRALDDLGLGEGFRAKARRQAPGSLYRPDGTRLATVDTGRIERRASRAVSLIPRADLLDLLHSSLPEGTVEFSAEITGFRSVSPGYDVVIGADGISSRVRAELFGPRYGLRHAGTFAWRGVVDLDLDAGGETWDPGGKFGFVPLPGGRTNWYATRRVPEGFTPPADDLTELTAQFGTWHDPIPRVLERAAGEEILAHPLYYLDPPLPSYVRENVALLGDAAHAMVPDLGQGACQALIDGLVLGECLTSSADPRDALVRYDRLRRRPSQRVAALALRVAAISYVRRFTRIRDTLVKAASALM